MRPDILTAAGRYFDFEHPEQCEFGIEEIAHALSHICRFTGHTRVFYSVAQHSVLVSHLVPPEDALAGLLHDAAEAFIGDVAKPLKRLLPDYQEIERRVEAAVFARLGVSPQLPSSVKRADLQALAIERNWLLPKTPGVEWPLVPSNLLTETWLESQTSYAARCRFIDRYNKLTGRPGASGQRIQVGEW